MQGALPALSPAFLADLVASACDVTLLIAPDMTVASVLANPRSGLGATIGRWRGQPLQDVLTGESWAKVDARLRAGDFGAGVPVVLELNHRDGTGVQLPVQYTVSRMDGGSGLLMVGRDLRPMAEVQQQLVNAQLALERDYEVQRELETRYRVLMEMSGAPIVLISMASGQIVDLNAQAEFLLGASRHDLLHTPAAQEFHGRRRGELLESLSLLATADPDEELALTVRRTSQRVAVRISMFRSAGDKLLLCQFRPVESGAEAPDRLSDLMNRVFHRGVDPIVFLDGDGLVKFANEAFLNLTDSRRRAEVVGHSFADFMARGVVDLRVLMDNVKRIGHIRHYTTRLNTDYSGQVAVEISANYFDDRRQPVVALVIRDVTAVESVRSALSVPGNEGLRNVMQLVGYSTLRDIVSETTEIIEKMCIETALELTGNNRVAAAELLSLSRQSLYVKLRKFGMLSREE